MIRQCVRSVHSLTVITLLRACFTFRKTPLIGRSHPYSVHSIRSINILRGSDPVLTVALIGPACFHEASIAMAASLAVVPTVKRPRCSDQRRFHRPGGADQDRERVAAGVETLRIGNLFQLLASHTLPDGSIATAVFRTRASLV